MLTSTTPSRAKACPSYMRTAELPLLNAPPWIHTITGALPPGSGVQTLRVSQSSPAMLGSGSRVSNGATYSGFGGVALNSVHARTPSDGVGGSGARNRSGPVGLAAYGMPRNLVTLPADSPLTLPYLVVTVVMRALCHNSRGDDQPWPGGFRPSGMAGCWPGTGRVPARWPARCWPGAGRR